MRVEDHRRRLARDQPHDRDAPDERVAGVLQRRGRHQALERRPRMDDVVAVDDERSQRSQKTLMLISPAMTSPVGMPPNAVTPYTKSQNTCRTGATNHRTANMSMI